MFSLRKVPMPQLLPSQQPRRRADGLLSRLAKSRRADPEFRPATRLWLVVLVLWLTACATPLPGVNSTESGVPAGTPERPSMSMPPPPPPPPPKTAPSPVTVTPPPQGEIYPVWYGTNRRPLNAKDESQGYANQRDKSVHYGKVFVDIPADFLQSARNESWLKKLFFKGGESSLSVRNRVPLSFTNFMADLREEIGQNAADERFALIYIHGFQTTFDEAAQRAAGIGYQIKSPTTAFFSWPSQGSLAGYEADKNAVEASTDQLAAFIIQVVRESGASKVHLIAHSMGNYALMQTMFRPVMQKAIQSGLRFGQIILAAPDVDTGVFVRDAHIYTDVAERVTLYASSKDMALVASRKLAEFPRAGLLPPAVVVPGIDTLDVSAVNLTFLGHSYVANEIQVLEDMNKLILHGDPPRKRSRVQPADNGAWFLR